MSREKRRGNWISRLIRRAIVNAVDEPNSNQILLEILRGTETASGKFITPDKAMRIAAVNSCVRIISEAIASMPLHIYHRLVPKGRELAPDHPLYRILHTSPNSWQTSFEFREMLQSHLLLRGNGFGYKNIVNSILREIVPMNPDLVDVYQRPDKSLFYVYTTEEAGPLQLEQNQVMHLRGLTKNGYVGVGIVQDARETMGGALATEEYGNRLFANDASPGIVLLHPSRFKEDAIKRLQESWDAEHAGSSRSHKTAILEEGVKIEKLSMSAEDAQFLETRKFQRSEIAGLFRVPPWMIGDVEKNTSWGTGIEAQGIGFVTYTLLPWIIRWEQRILKDLITADLWYFPKFTVEGLMRGSMKDRYEAYAQGIQNEWLSPDEVRELEDMNPRSDGLGGRYQNPNTKSKPDQKPARPGWGSE